MSQTNRIELFHPSLGKKYFWSFIYFHMDTVDLIHKNVPDEVIELDLVAADTDVPREDGIYPVLVYGIEATAYLWWPMGYPKTFMKGLVVLDSDEKGHAHAKSLYEKKAFCI